MNAKKAVGKLRAQSAANRSRAEEMLAEAVQVVHAAEARAKELRGMAQEELDEAKYWEGLADQEAAKIPPEPEQTDVAEPAGVPA